MKKNMPKLIHENRFMMFPERTVRKLKQFHARRKLMRILSKVPLALNCHSLLESMEEKEKAKVIEKDKDLGAVSK
jgi:hypothetical protein